MPHALVVDRNAESLERIRQVLSAQEFSSDAVHSSASARDLLLRVRPEVLIINLNGKNIARRAKLFHFLGESHLADVTQIFLLSSSPSYVQAVEGMRVGASDIFAYPDDLDKLGEALASFRQEMACEASDEDAVHKSGRGLMLGESPPMQRLYTMLRKVAPSDVSVFLCGESGSGKELVAHTIHALSPRSHCPFVAVNCGAIAAELAESELFGHVKGAFTGAHKAHTGLFQQAEGGTLFLDELTEMRLDLQVKLLRVLESRAFQPVGGEQTLRTDVRILASSNRNIQEAIEEGLLREDLYYRIAQFPLDIPSLRERGDDIALLAEAFLAELCREHNVSKQFSEEALDALRIYHWPGNVRELRNVVARAFLLAGTRVELDDLPGELIRGEPAAGDHLRLSVGQTLEDVERRIILATLDHHQGNKTVTAKELGISLKTLYNRLKRYEQHRDTAR
ncbi:MAG: sigma-54-dependent Fis family transcriptional regulator [Halioglobus sp.]|nr:sigma-54-dependent Fis family transcriptional regulator [Halioglobus sp.]